MFISNSTEPVIVTTLTFVRKLHTADQFDRDITLDQPNDMIYAYANADENGLVYHGDNHNHIFVDFTKADGIPDNQFGYEESGALSRDLVKNSFYGTLSTMQSEAAGAMNVANYPFGSVADFADEEPSTGRPLLLLSDLERNVINMKTNPKVSLSIDTLPSTVAEFKNPNLFDEMTHPRTTLLGTMELIPKDSPELQQAKDTYLAKHPLAKAWINFSDFNMYRMIVEDVYVVGGFGNDHYIGYISSEQYLSVSMQ